jgi:uncharacterized membrane protein
MDSSLFLYQLGGYTAKLAHVFGAIIWIGGVLFMAGVATPIVNYYTKPENDDPRVVEIVGKLEERLIGFNWMALWTVFISGGVLALYGIGFQLLRFESLPEWAFNLKVFFFLPVALINFLLSASYRELRSARASLIDGEDLSPHQITEWRIVSLRRINVYLAFAIIIFVAML